MSGLAIGGELHARFDWDARERREAIVKRNLGRYIQSHWGGSGGPYYESLDAISGGKANGIAQEHLNRFYGDAVKPSGAVKPFNMDVAYGSFSGSLPGDPVKSEITNPFSTAEAPVRVVQNPVGWRSRTPVRIGASGLVVLGAAAVSGMVSGFAHSKEDGVVQISRVGTDWLGYELGAAAVKVLQLATRRFSSPLAVSAGIFSSVLADNTIAPMVENRIRHWFKPA